jgi:HAD superfamily hydrolase (TIGR01549 family)
MPANHDPKSGRRGRRFESEGAVVRSSSGSLSGFAIWREHLQAALTACGYPDASLASRAVTHYARVRASRYRFFGDVEESLSALRGRGDALALVTNGPGDTQRHKLSATRIDRRFDAIVTSGEVGVAKPDPRIFEIAARLLDVLTSIYGKSAGRRGEPHTGDPGVARLSFPSALRPGKIRACPPFPMMASPA